MPTITQIIGWKKETETTCCDNEKKIDKKETGLKITETQELYEKGEKQDAF